MAELNVEILKTIKSEGYKINETIRDALEDFIEVLQEENDTMDDGEEEDDEEKDWIRTLTEKESLLKKLVRDELTEESCLTIL